MKLNKNIEYNYVGPCLTISITTQLKYEDYETFELPTSCIECPVGFCNTKCGRNVPFKAEDYHSRPQSCKLKKISAEEVTERFLKELKLQESDKKENLK